MVELQKINENVRSAKLRLIDRIPPLQPSMIRKSVDGVGIELILPGTIQNGVVRLTFEAYQYNFGNVHPVIVSYIESPINLDNKNPSEGVATAFTSAAIINEAARLCGKPVLHKVLANENSMSLYERLKDWGIYTYCDALGNTVPNPVHGGSITNKVFYSCLYPNLSVGKLLKKYEINNASKKLVEHYPTPIRLVQHRLTQIIQRGRN